MCWRIVRIEDDGSTKLILEDKNAECNGTSYTGVWNDGSAISFGGGSDRNFLKGQNALADNLKSFQSTNLTKYITKLKANEWCYETEFDGQFDVNESNNNKFIYREEEFQNYNNASTTFTRVFTKGKPSLVCTGTKLTNYFDNTVMYVGGLTADEVAFAGADRDQHDNKKFYLMNSNFLNWWTLSTPTNANNSIYIKEYAFIVGYQGNVNIDLGFCNNYIRPAITLKANATISTGTGTQTNPYIIN